MFVEGLSCGVVVVSLMGEVGYILMVPMIGSGSLGRGRCCVGFVRYVYLRTQLWHRL